MYKHINVYIYIYIFIFYIKRSRPWSRRHKKAIFTKFDHFYQERGQHEAADLYVRNQEMETDRNERF